MMSKRVITYARTSTEEQSRHSIEQQQEAIQRYCNLNGYTIVKEFHEHCSAKDFNRPFLRIYTNMPKKIEDLLMLCISFVMIDSEGLSKLTLLLLKNLESSVSRLIL